MPKSLVIVESPSKAKTLEKFLGKNFKVLASYGHVRDLPRKGLGVDRAHGYKPTYEVLKGKEKTLSDLRKAARGSEAVYLAADPDREGEAISWHLLQELRPAAKGVPFRRARFNEITKKAVVQAIEQAGSIDEDRVDAQQARRIIDRLVGYEVSDLLWKKIWRGLSAGRVQTVTLRIICEREKEIEAFVPVEYWSLDARLAAHDPPEFTARLFSFAGEKLKFDGSDPRVADAAHAERLRAEIGKASWKVARLEKSERRKSAPPPFVTSQLQQAASRRLGFSVRRAMQLAQRLYEGREIGDRGTVGLITYMRTDSTRVSSEALEAVRGLIGSQYGPEYVPESPRYFKARTGAQEAHEAIRPTMLDLPPDAVARYLSPEEGRLYRIIWERFVASQMNPALYENVSADIEAGRALYHASGSTLKFPGYLAAYGISAEDEEGEKEEGSALPALSEGEVLRLVALSPERHETQPPPRFNEASLVKYLEENGIGRPSTYAEIIRKIEDREYVRKKEKRFYPTALGRVVIELLIPYFDDFFETGYTARMEEELDEVEEGKLSWTKALADFDKKFVKDRDRALEKMSSSKAGIPLKEARKAFGFALVPEIADTCPKDAKALKLRMGKNGLFVACSGYPDCDFTYNVPETEEDAPDLTEYENQICEECGSPMKLRQSGDRPFLGCSAYPKCRNTVAIAAAASRAAAEPQKIGEKCPEDGGDLVRKRGRFGEFVACSNYPKCKYRPPKPLVETGVECPKDGGKIVVRRGRFGFFYPCANYPKCDFSFRYRPHPKPCPACGRPYLLEKTLKREGTFLFCDNPACGHKETVSRSVKMPPTEPSVGRSG
jgi:DNA topoisomerase-1